MISGEVDFTELKELGENLEKIDVDAMCEHIAKKTAAKLLRTVKSATPRGEHQALVRGWNVNTYDLETGEKKESNVVKHGNEYEVVLKNNVYYAGYVEHGHRQQPGRYVPAIGKRLKRAWVSGKHFVLKSEIKVRRELPRLVKAEMKRWIKKELKL